MRVSRILGFAILSSCVVNSSGHATQPRLMGMGELRLVVEDETNMIGLYDFGGNVAGLYLDEPMSTLNGGFSYGTVSQSDLSGTLGPRISYIGQPLPDNLGSYVPASYCTLLPTGAPLGADLVYRMQSRAIGIKGNFARARATFGEADSSITVNVFPHGVVQYNTFFGNQLSFGLEAGYLRAKQTTDPGMSKSTTNSLGGGFGIGFLASETTTLGGTFNYVRPKLETEIEIDTSVVVGSDTFNLKGSIGHLDGNGFDFGAQWIYQLLGLFKAGAKFGYNSLSGNADMVGSDTTFGVGSLKNSGFALETRALTTFFLVPLQLGVSLGYIRENRKFEASAGMGELAGLIVTEQLQRSISTIPFGFGLVYATPTVTAGGEFHYTIGRETDEAADVTLSSSVLAFNLGTEVIFGPGALRGGFVVSNTDPNRDCKKDELTTKKFTLGFGLNPPGSMFEGDFAYNYIVASPNENPEKQKSSTNVISAGIKLFF